MEEGTTDTKWRGQDADRCIARMMTVHLCEDERGQGDSGDASGSTEGFVGTRSHISDQAASWAGK